MPRRLRGRTRWRTLPKLRRAEEAVLFAGANGAPDGRPRTRDECRDGARPCAWISCRYHLALDVSPHGSIRLNFGRLALDKMEETCALDVAERGGATHDRIGKLMNLTRERIRQVELHATFALRAVLHGSRVDPLKLLP